MKNRLTQYFGDAPSYRDVRYRLKRTGREEWLDDRADLTDDVDRAAVFTSATEASLFCITHVDEPSLWHFEPFMPATR